MAKVFDFDPNRQRLICNQKEKGQLNGPKLDDFKFYKGIRQGLDNLGLDIPLSIFHDYFPESIRQTFNGIYFVRRMHDPEFQTDNEEFLRLLHSIEYEGIKYNEIPAFLGVDKEVRKQMANFK